jgi:L-threonylcarbamoyladenylate synthase
MENDLQQAVEVLRQGGLILYPTDTIWGIGCDATDEKAVEKVYALKKRQDEKSLLVLLDRADKLPDYMDEVPEMAWNLLEIADKPLTIIYPGARNLARNLVAFDGSVGIRIVQDEFCRKLVQRFGKPVVSTSANISGQPWPAGFHKIDRELVKAVDYVVKHRQYDTGGARPSGIIKLGVHGEVQVIRE